MRRSRRIVCNIATTIVVAFMVSAVSAAFYRDWMFRRNIRDGIKASKEAIESCDDRKLVNAVRQVDENFHIYYDHHVFLSNKICREVCDYIKWLTNQKRIQTDFDFLHILVEPIDHMAFTLTEVKHNKVGEYRVVKLVTDYNFNWKAEREEIDDGVLENALEKDSNHLILYDVACRHYYDKGLNDLVVSSAMKSFKYEGADIYRADILYYMKQALNNYGTMNWDAGTFLSNSSCILSGINLDTFVPSTFVPFIDEHGSLFGMNQNPDEPYPMGGG